MSDCLFEKIVRNIIRKSGKDALPLFDFDHSAGAGKLVAWFPGENIRIVGRPNSTVGTVIDQAGRKYMVNLMNFA